MALHWYTIEIWNFRMILFLICLLVHGHPLFAEYLPKEFTTKNYYILNVTKALKRI